MRTIVLIAFCLSGFVNLRAHPSWGMAVTNDGDIYFVDVLHNETGTLWRLDRHGKLEALLTDFHAHDLFLDRKGQLWIAEAIWKTGIIEGEGHNYLHRYDPETGTLDTLIFTDDWDEFFGGGLAVDTSENVYFSIHNQLFHKPLDGPARLVIQHTFGRINTIQADDRGNIWLTDKAYQGGTLFRWNAREGLKAVATGLLSGKATDPVFKEKNHQIFYGIAFDPQGNVYVADNVYRRIHRVSPDGRVSVFYQSEAPWHPVGLSFLRDTAYIMETGWQGRHLGPRLLKGTLADVTKGVPSMTELVNMDHRQEQLKRGSMQPQTSTPPGASGRLLLAAFMLLSLVIYILTQK